MRIGIVGAGRVGLSLYLALRERHQVLLLSRRAPLPEHGGLNWDKFKDFLVEAELVFLALRDGEIRPAAERLALGPVKNKVFAHTSGALSSGVLEPIRERGGLVASFHPAAPVPKPDPKAFRGAHCGLEGDRGALSALVPIARELGMKPFFISTEKKSLYHASCVIASNFLAPLLALATELGREAGAPQELYIWLFSKAAEAAVRLGPERALTGPAARGDTETISLHLSALGDKPKVASLYALITSFIHEQRQGGDEKAR